MDEQNARLALRAWVVSRGNVTEAELKDDSSLVSDGMINSLDVFDLISKLEGLRGRPIDAQALTGEEFKSINTLVSAFFKDEA